MNNPSDNSKSSLLDWLLNLFRSPAPPAPAAPSVPNPVAPPVKPALPPDNTTEPVRIVTSRVLLLIYDPVMNTSTGEKLSQVMQWQRPDDLANTFIQDIQETSGGMARYQVIQRIELNEFPVLADGFRYDAASYMKVQNKVQPPHVPQEVDFHPIHAGLNILPRVARNEIDEVWIFNFPYAGFPESVMGGQGAFWCNNDPLASTTSCARRFIIMGFSYERGVGEMLESFGHRSESMVSAVFNCQSFVVWAYKTGRVPATLGPDPTFFSNLPVSTRSRRASPALGRSIMPPTAIGITIGTIPGWSPPAATAGMPSRISPLTSARSMRASGAMGISGLTTNGGLNTCPKLPDGRAGWLIIGGSI